MIDTRLYPPRHTLAGQLITPLGHRANGRPIWPVFGAADGDDDGTGDDDDSGDGKDDDSGDGKDDDPWAGKTDAELKAELSRLSSAHTTAKKQAKSWREKFQGKASGDDDDDDLDDDTKAKPKAKPAISRAQVKAAEKAAEDKARNELMPVLVATTAESLLVAAGMAMPKDPEQRAAKVRRAVRNMDLEDVELVDGRLVGVDDAVNAFKVEYAELFGKAQVRTGKLGNAGGSRSGGGKDKTVTELQAEALFGGKD